MKDRRGKTVGAVMLVGIVVAACNPGGTQPRPNPPPTPVRVADPASRPDLTKINGFLLSNNTMLGCDEVPNFQLFAAAGDTQPPPDSQSHLEPPIGGFDGSFELDMQPQKLLGTTASTLKLCGNPHAHAGSQGKWELIWKVWKRNGTELDNGRKPLSMNKLSNLEVSFVNNTTHKVTYQYTSMVGGKAWEVAATGATFKGNQTTGFQLDVVNPQTLRMQQITIKEQTGSTKILLARERGSCAAFRICHDGEGCELPKIPAPCNPRPKPNPSGKSPSRL